MNIAANNLKDEIEKFLKSIIDWLMGVIENQGDA